ncbi:segregation and condensation protein A [Streptomyces zagrosensis]|uniref:Segregation and condensation protein A n=1 Tax=Streptomyces zagrosensis TaxID=1042984 RepID=A0A7W9V051_9ACTN|nr:segregation/condensation protein A [Streptomyces zagrosensis]MBB5937457.1 segregation and condensation protein A [Streptomyces zagrosensis]
MPTNADPTPPMPPRGNRRSLGRGPGAQQGQRPTHPPEHPATTAEPGEPAREALRASDRDEGPVDGPAGAEGPAAAREGAAEAEPLAVAGAGARDVAPDAATVEAGPKAAEGLEEAEGQAAGGPAEAVREAAAATAPQAQPAAGPAADAATQTGTRTVPDDGRFTVRLANFAGPFDLLLQLISRHKMDVTEVALSKVTDEFMIHIRAMGPDWDLDQTTEFLVVAATLLDLKAARLLPSAEVEDEADLALLEARDLLFARLLQYRAYKRIADIFQERLDDEARRYPRTVGLEPHHAELLPEVVIRIGAAGFAKLAVKAMQPRAKPQVYVDHIHAPLVSVREQADVVMARLRELGVADFQTLTADAPDTLTIVARFLALLELYRERVIALDQDEALGALLVRWTGAEGERPQVTDEFDQEPGARSTGARSTEARAAVEGPGARPDPAVSAAEPDTTEDWAGPQTPDVSGASGVSDVSGVPDVSGEAGKPGQPGRDGEWEAGR